MGLVHSPNIVTNGLVLCLDAANRRSYPGTGTVWNDLSGNGNHGTLTNGPTFSRDNGGSIVFDGTNDSIIITNNDLKVSFSQMTIILWFKKPSHAGYQNVIERGIWDYDDGFGIYTNADKLLWGHWAEQATSNTTVCDDTIKHIACTYNTSNIASIYINGIFDKSKQQNRSITASTFNLSIFARVDSSFYGNGVLYNLQIYNRTLSAQEILRNYNAIRGRFH